MKCYFGKIGRTFVDSLLQSTLNQLSYGDVIGKTVYERNYRFALRCDLYLLRLLSEPTTVYDVIKKLDYPHSTAYEMLQEYLNQGIIKETKSERLKSGLTKRQYRLTDLGFGLLEIAEKISNNMSD